MTKLLRMCSECRKINVNGGWVGREYPYYQKEIDSAEQITDGYCTEHLNNNQLRKNKILSKKNDN